MKKESVIITIDGPTASGKSTIGKKLAQVLNFYYINSGLLFRDFAYAFFKEIDLLRDTAEQAELQIAELQSLEAQQLEPQLAHSLVQNENAFFEQYDKWRALADQHKESTYDYSHEKGARIIYDGKDVTEHLRTPLLDKAASLIAMDNTTRLICEVYQHQLVNKHPQAIIDGRDAGTIVFPKANYKFFFTADLEIRAERWQKDQEKKGNTISLEKCIAFIHDRDKRDSERNIAPLKPAEHAIIIDTTSLTIDEVIEQCLLHIKK